MSLDRRETSGAASSAGQPHSLPTLVCWLWRIPMPRSVSLPTHSLPHPKITASSTTVTQFPWLYILSYSCPAAHSGLNLKNHRLQSPLIQFSAFTVCCSFQWKDTWVHVSSHMPISSWSRGSEEDEQEATTENINGKPKLPQGAQVLRLICL